MNKKENKKDRELQSKQENYLKQRASLINQGYTEYRGVISVLKANVFAFITAGPFVILAIIIYIVVWGEYRFMSDVSESIILLIGLILTIFIHELIHGITWSLFCDNKWKSIRFGIMWKYLTPYCHCMKPLKFGSYITGCLMPFILLGIGISAIGIVSNNNSFVALGALNILAAGGDTTIALMLLKYRKCIILDHPSECGFVAFEKIDGK